MEKWLEHLCEKIAYCLDSYGTKYATILEDDQLNWWKETLMSLIQFKTIKTYMFGGLTEVVFRLGDFRINFYTNKDFNWLDCKWTPITPQKNEMCNIVEAFVATLLVRFKEHDLDSERIDDWIVNQCKARKLPYEFPSFLR